MPASVRGDYTVDVREVPPFAQMATVTYEITSVTDSVFGDARNFCGPFPRKPPFTCTAYPEVLHAPPGGASMTNFVTVGGTQTVTPDFGPPGASLTDGDQRCVEQRDQWR